MDFLRDDSTEFGLIEPFDTEDGSLEGISPEYAFALGVEWEMFRQRLKTGKPFTAFCMLQNTARFVKMVERHNRFVEDRPSVSEGWSEIYIGDYIVRKRTT